MMQDLIARYSDRTKYNLLLPPTFAVSQAGGMYQISFREVSINADPTAKEVYNPKGNRDFALTKSALDKLSSLAGITWSQTETGFLDAPKGMLRHRSVGALKNSDGTPIVATATRTMFYTTPTPAEFDCEKVESKSKNRVIRQLLAIKSVYTREELQRPFVVLRVDLALDMSDPNIKMLVAQRAVDMMTNLFGPPPSIPQLAAPATIANPSPAVAAPAGATVLPESNAPDPEDLDDYDDDPPTPARQAASQQATGEARCCTCDKVLSARDVEYTIAKGKPGQCYTCRQAKRPVPSSAMSPTATPQGPKPPSSVTKPPPQQASAELNEVGFPVRLSDPNGWSGEFPTVDAYEVMSPEDKAVWDPRIERAVQIARGQGTLPLGEKY